jgi:DNA anti-recombination protein RmuC
MPVMLDQPTNEKLDALGAKVDDLRTQMEKGFERVDAELRQQRQEMKAGFNRVDERFVRGEERVNERFVHVEERFDERFERMHRLLVQLCGGIIVALIGLIATQV